ncbi:MAG: hypothetical protein GJU73_09260 [Ferrovum sp.]|jgi:hypothetical protein|uniref:hypothetical protein n=1 Tax=Ferrovum sp. TaxID=2609467 RepID=UPI00260C619D|nr:hypothetical protein [Ferrovum sp.]MBW8067619.1 hypothetical protein [Ferrovum sp.]
MNAPTRGRGKSKASLAIIEAAHEILTEIQPASTRAVCYKLFVGGIISSMSRANTAKVGMQLVYARENGLIPWAWIVDETREAERVSMWDDPEGVIRTAMSCYRKNIWADQDNWVEVWSEKGTLRGTLAPVLSEYGVTFRVMHGYGSATALHGIAEETSGNDKPLTVLYCGDFDPSGMHMSEIDLPGRIGRYGGDAEIIRVALDADDIATGTTLPSFDLDTKKQDPRHQWFAERYGGKCWEVDALSPVILRSRVEAHIRSFINLDAWEHALRIEAVEKDSMIDVLTAWRSISHPDKKYSPEA